MIDINVDVNFNDIENNLIANGYTPLQKSDSDYIFRRFCTIREFTGVLKARLIRHGAKIGCQISVVYSRSDDLVSIYIPDSNELVEFPGRQAASILWHAGVR